MAEHSHPGVYIEEVPSGVRPIEGVSTSTACFIGKAEMGALNKAVLVTSMPEFQTKYGAFLSDSWLAHSVMQFFNNGGKKTYIVRVAGTGAQAASITIKDRRGTPASTLVISAANEGVWGNKLDVVIKDGTADPNNEFSIGVFRDRSDLNPPKDPLPLESHDNLSMDPNAANFVEKVLAANSQYISATADVTNLGTTAGMLGTSRSAKLRVGSGSAALKLSVGATADVDGAGKARLTSGAGADPNPKADRRRININLNGDGAREITIPLVDENGAPVNTGQLVADEIRKAVSKLTANTLTNQNAYNGFTASFNSGTGTYVLLSGMGGTIAVTDVIDPVTSLAAEPVSIAAGKTFKFTVYINGDGPHEVVVNGPQADGDAIALAIRNYVQTQLTPKRTANAAALTGFTAQYINDTSSVNNPAMLLTSGAPGANASVRVSNGPAGGNLASLLKLGTSNSGTEIKGSAIVRPANSLKPNTEFHLGDAPTGGNVAAVAAGDDGLTPQETDYTISGLTALDTVRDVNILAIPGLGTKNIVDAGVNYCALRGDCFYVAEADALTDTQPEARTFVDSLTVKSSYGALYYPWLLMTDPTGLSGLPLRVPPSGFVAGMYARIDAKRGVWKAPAGTEANLGGAVGLAADTTDTQQDFLNPAGVNVLRMFPASGLVIWGARTLATRSDPEYRYVPIRRTAIYLEQSIYNGIQWAVFEPNDEPLWASLRLNIGAFMLLQFRAGAFQGKTAGDAFFVKCDSTTTSQADIDAGVVNILVGFAPLKPAEFVVLRITQIVKTAA